MKTNVDFNNSHQEEGIFKSKERNKDKNKENKNKNEEIPKNNNSNRNYDENDEKNKEDIKININNNKIIIENNDVNDVDVNNKEYIKKGDNIEDIIKNVIEEEKKEEDPLVTYIASNRKISEQEIKNAPKLFLEEMDGTLFNGKTIEINAGGMINGRNKKDGFTIFGQKKNNSNSNTEIPIQNEVNNKNNDNDIFIPDLELNYSNYLGYPYIFSVYYKIEEKSYFIRAYCGKGSDNKILFIKLNHENKYILKRKELISAGNIIFQVSPKNNNCIEIINLTSKKLINKRQIFDGFNKKRVTIGRHKDCDFFFPKDKSFSRYQTTFEFDEEKKEWSLLDGKDKKASTNGTWIFGIHSFLIKNEMIIEILNSKIRIKEVKIDKNDEH